MYFDTVASSFAHASRVLQFTDNFTYFKEASSDTISFVLIFSQKRVTHSILHLKETFFLSGSLVCRHEGCFLGLVFDDGVLS